MSVTADAKRTAQQGREGEDSPAQQKKEAEQKMRQEGGRAKNGEEQSKKIAQSNAKAAERAAVKATKNKKKSSWVPSRRTMIISAIVAIAAMGYRYYQSLPEARRLAAADQAFKIGNTYYEHGELRLAMHQYQLAISGNPLHADAWCNLGNAYSSLWQTMSEDQSMLQQAVYSYKKAIEINPRHVDAHFNLGVLFHTLEKVDLAIPEYQKAIELDAKHFDALSNLGSAKHKLQDLDGAIAAYQKAIGILESMNAEVVDQSQVSMLYYLLGTAMSGLPDERCADGPCLEQAAGKLRQALAHNPENEEARHALSALMADPNVTAASAKYIRSLFDEYAANFDNALLRGLDYQAPELLRDAVTGLAQTAGISQFDSIYDAGCGTGLCGPLFRNLTERLVCVDLSEPMVEKARERGVYDELEVADVLDSLRAYANASDPARHRTLHLLLAADVFVYTGDVAPVMAAAAAALRPGGYFALTLERLEAPEPPAAAAAEGGAAPTAAEASEARPPRGPKAGATEADLARGWKLQLSGRFAHTRDYAAAAAAAAGFRVAEHRHVVPRKDNGADVQGHLFILELTR